MPISLFEHLYGAPKQAPLKGTDYGGAPAQPDTRSQPPTAQPLTIINEASVGQAAYGAGGGGGGANPAVSSLTVAPGGQITLDTNTTLTLTFNVGNPANIQYNVNDSNAYILNQMINAHPMAPAEVSSVQGIKPSYVNQNGQFEGLQIGGLIFDGNGQGDVNLTPAMASDTAGNLSIWASNVNISSLNVSSINGQTPGGGGAYNPDPAFSTIAFPDFTSSPALKIQGGINFFDASTAAQTDGAIRTGIPGNQLFSAIPATPANALIFSSPSGFGTSITVGATDGAGAYVVAADDNGLASTLTVIADSVVIPNNLTVSSINGQAPGGGSVSPNLEVSTLTVDGTGFITLNQGAVLGTQDDFVIQSDKSATATARFWTSTTTFTAEGSNANNLAIYNAGASPITDSLNLISQEGAPAVIRCDAGVRFQAPSVAVSSFTVSSINGNAYPPPSAGGLYFSSIGIPGGAGAAFNSDPNVVNQAVSWSVVPNHVYSVYVAARVQTNTPTVLDSDNVYLEILPNGGSTQALGTVWGVQLSTLTQNGVYSESGGTVIFKAPVNAVSTAALGILGTVSTLTRVDVISLVDMGAI